MKSDIQQVTLNAERLLVAEREHYLRLHPRSIKLSKSASQPRFYSDVAIYASTECWRGFD